MRSADELQRLWDARPAPPRGAGTVRLIVVRTGGGRHQTPSAARLSTAGGVAGDRWSEQPNRSAARQVTLMTAAVAELLAGDQLPLHLPGDNLLVDLDLSEAALPAGARLRVGGAVLEISAVPHTGCAKFAARFGEGALAWVNAPDGRARRLRGVNCAVVEDGDVAVGDPVRIL